MDKRKIAEEYLRHLENGDVEEVINLFNDRGIVESPIYGIKRANEFYRELDNDTLNSRLYLKGIFEEKEQNSIAIYFTYKWTLKNNKKVEFDVVDIIEFDPENRIKKLKIIYDTFVARKLVNDLNRK